jgi:hypothetical protein
MTKYRRPVDPVQAVYHAKITVSTKNEEILIYDAPASATFPRMFSSSARRF